MYIHNSMGLELFMLIRLISKSMHYEIVQENGQILFNSVQNHLDHRKRVYV